MRLIISNCCVITFLQCLVCVLLASASHRLGVQEREAARERLRPHVQDVYNGDDHHRPHSQQGKVSG